MSEVDRLVESLLEDRDHVHGINVQKLIHVAKTFQAANPYPDYGVLYFCAATKSVIYNVGDGQPGDLKKLEADFRAVDGVEEVEIAEIADECGQPAGFKKIWYQGQD